MKNLAIYVHIPFCLARCPYCDFNVYVEKEIPEDAYAKSVIEEVRLTAEKYQNFNQKVRSIYFGGGTPSLFSPTSLGKICESIKQLFPCETDIEITLEANPNHKLTKLYSKWLEIGINRISFGSQSLNDKTLRLLGRNHSARNTMTALKDARQAGFHNINLDLIFAAPEQSIGELESDIAGFVELAPDHISAYQLTIEKGTPFFTDYSLGKLKLPNDEISAEMFELIINKLERSGYEHYEISNFAKANLYSRHNLGYWNGDNYLGFGAGAHSFYKDPISLKACRWSNLAKPKEYINCLSNVSSLNFPRAWQEELSQESLVFEFFFLGLRKISGVSLKNFQELFGEDLKKIYLKKIDPLISKNLINQEGDRIYLSKRGIMLADSVFEYLL